MKGQFDLDYYIHLIEQNNADGIDFIELNDGFWSCDPMQYKIVASYTVEQLKSYVVIPKTPALCWKMIDGQKYYFR